VHTFIPEVLASASSPENKVISCKKFVTDIWAVLFAGQS